MSRYEKGHGRRGRLDKKHDGGKQKPVVGATGAAVLESIDENSPIIQSFRKYSAELDAKHDKYERIVKLSRDITIESKRIIFLLHNMDRDSKSASILEEAETRLGRLLETHFFPIAKELHKEDPYQFHRAYTAGMQEYIEALTFYRYLKGEALEHWDSVQKGLIYTVPESAQEEEPAMEVDKEETSTEVSAFLLPTDYFLGIADLTGELMRKCINNLGLGKMESCYHTCAFVRQIYNGFLGIGNTGTKEMSRKIFTLRQSLAKMEYTCYTIHVRGSEIPKHMLADVLAGGRDDVMDDDEGFY
ncbi:translin-associated protein X [Bacillus rossius redtenbacheri]|uniref:translin-associated protein X n=1 Tax=Bacillus rossius redtenbacheri TaxID=93214 RepID=UPI002FDDEF5F